MYLIDHVAELRFVNRLIYVIKRIYTHTSFAKIGTQRTLIETGNHQSLKAEYHL